MATKNFSDYAVQGQNVTLTYDNINDTVTFDVVVDKTDVGLGNVDNTSDANKPVSTAQQTALNLKQNSLVSGTNIKTVNSNTLLGSGDLVIDKTSVGLGNVANVDTTNATNITSGTLGDARLTANVTTQGNTFNTANKLVQLDGTAKLPAIDGSQLTNLPTPTTPTLATVTTAGNTTTNAITVGKLNVINTSTTIAPVVISGTNPFSGGAGVDYLVINGTGNVGTTLKTDVGGYVAHRFYGNNVELGVFYVGETNKEFVFKNSTTGYIDFQTTSSSTSRLRIFNNGNVGINTTTDAGYKLDVNGTVRVKGTGTTTGVTLSVQNSSSTNLLTVTDAGNFATTTSNFSSVVTNNSNSFQVTGGIAAIRVGGSISVVASAILQADSTTQGFLPPRMTTTQKNAIATPAAGLVVYDTTDNKHYGYNGTTWNAFY